MKREKKVPFLPGRTLSGFIVVKSKRQNVNCTFDIVFYKNSEELYNYSIRNIILRLRMVKVSVLLDEVMYLLKSSTNCYQMFMPFSDKRVKTSGDNFFQDKNNHPFFGINIFTSTINSIKLLVNNCVLLFY